MTGLALLAALGISRFSIGGQSHATARFLTAEDNAEFLRRLSAIAAEVVATARARCIEETALRDARAAGYLDDVRARLAGLPPTVRPEVARALLDLALAVRLGATDADVAGLEGA